MTEEDSWRFSSNMRFEELTPETTSRLGSYSKFSYIDEEPSIRPAFQVQARKLSECVMMHLQKANNALNRASEFKVCLSEDRKEFLQLAQKVADEEFNDKNFLVERHKEKLYTVVNDLRGQERQISSEMDSSYGVSEAFVVSAKEKLKNTLEVLHEEQENLPAVSFEIEVISKKNLQDLKHQLYSAKKELENIRHNMTPDTARIGPKRTIKELESTISKLESQNHLLSSEKQKFEEENQKLNAFTRREVQLDKVLSKKIQDLMNALHDYNNRRVDSDSWYCFKSSVFREDYNLDNINASRSFENLNLLKHLIMNTLKLQEDKLKFRDTLSDKLLSSVKRNTSDERLKEEIRKEERNLVAEELVSLKEEAETKNSELKETQEQLHKLAKENKEAKKRLEKYSKVKTELENQVQRLQSKLNNSQEVETLKKQLQEKENKLKMLSEAPADFNPKFERELENVRKIYNDKYEELFKITTAQITELEQKLQNSEKSKYSLKESLASEIRKEEQASRQQEFKRLKQLHQREVSLLQKEFEEFVIKAHSEIRRLARLVEQGLASSEQGVLRGVMSDLQSLATRMRTKAQKVKEEKQEKQEENTLEEEQVQCNLAKVPLLDERVCKRCSKNDQSSKECFFHPYLVTSGCAEFLYGDEWHHCREAEHTSKDPPCYSHMSHYYGKEASFIKVHEDLPAMTFAPKEMTYEDIHEESPLKRDDDLGEALFFSQKKKEYSATAELEDYLSKFS